MITYLLVARLRLSGRNRRGTGHSCHTNSDFQLLLGKLATACCFIWKAQNKFLFDEVEVNHMAIAEWAYKSVNEFLIMLVSATLTIVAYPDSVPLSWCCPSGDLLKEDCDADVKGNRAAFACVVLVHDRSGSISDDFGKRVASGSSVLPIEALAVRKTCVSCLKVSIIEACIEINNASIVAWCSEEGGVPPWEISPIIYDIRSLAQSSPLSFVAIRMIVSD
ncbi:hypothetical protein LguiB_032737 [Lonicera macranthoides]